MNRRSIILTLGLLIAGWLAFFSDKPDNSEIAEPVKRASASAAARAGNTATPPASASARSSATPARPRASARAIAILALQDRTDLLGQATPTASASASTKQTTNPTGNDKKADAKDKNKDKNKATPTPIPADTVVAQALFDSQTWNPPPPPPPKPTPPPPPVAPPLPYIVLGKKSEDQKWEVYLARGDQVFIAREKESLENQYRVDSIKPPTMVLTYLPLNQVQTLSIGGID